MDKDVIACMYCGNPAKRTAQGIEDSTYECSVCQRSFGVDWSVEQAREGPLVLSLRTARPTISSKDEFALEFVLTNAGSEFVTITRPGDGSEMGWRPPRTMVTVRSMRGDVFTSQDLFHQGRCGMMNPLTMHDFVTLKPGESMKVTGWFWVPRNPGPGEYIIHALYENDPQMRTRGTWLGGADPKLIERLKNSFKCLVQSNMIRVVVE